MGLIYDYVNNMGVKRDSPGELEQLLMLAVARLGADAYGAQIQREMEAIAGRSLTISTIYVTLVRLEKKGLVESVRTAPVPVRGGKAKRSFRLTARGARSLEQARAVLERMWEGLDLSAEVDAERR